MKNEKYSNIKFHEVSKSEQAKLKIHSKITLNQVLGVLMALLHFICSGIVSGYSSVLVDQLNKQGKIPVTQNEATWLASSVVIPMAPSCLLSGLILTKIPKRTLLLTITLIKIASWIGVYFSTSVTALLASFAVMGSVNAMGSPAMNPYLAEISHPAMRGLAITMIPVGLYSGYLIIHTLGFFLSWTTCALVTIGILFVYFCLIIYSKETYVWFLRNNQTRKAKKAFYWYRGQHVDAIEEINQLLEKTNANNANEYSTIDMIRLCCSKFFLKPLIITTVGMFTYHFSASKALLFYSISIMRKVIPSLSEYTSTIIVDIIRILAMIIGCFLIKRFPIRYLFISSGTGSALSHLSFAIFTFYTTEENSQMFQIFRLISILAYTGCSTFGIAPLAWVIAGEIFPLILKGIGAGVGCFMYFFLFFVVVKWTPDLFASVGIEGGFLVFCGCTFIGTVIMYFILPETKNKTLEEIENLFK